MDKHAVVIVDYGMGNIRSIIRKVNQTGFKGIVTSDLNDIKSAGKLILPGVGNFLTGMNRLREKKLITILSEKVQQEKTPILGICLGMQLLTRFSEEGNSPGLGWIDGETVRFQLNDIRNKVPHMGWNSIQIKKESPLLADIPDNSNFYFVHSYHVRCNEVEDILTTTFYGYEFVSTVQRENVFGTQFHPEKSHKYGEKILLNFLSL
jgi:imidazole glycerol-phosphate synthase subunit HisH